MIEAGAKEQDLAKLVKPRDPDGPIVGTWWLKEREECFRKGYEDGRREAYEDGRREAYEERRAKAEARALVEHRAMLVHMAQRKFDAGTANELGPLLEEVAGSGRLAEIGELIIDCGTGQELLAKVANQLNQLTKDVTSGATNQDELGEATGMQP